MLTVNKFIADGKKVDYIFGDLTDIPISESACGELWEFMITILNSSFKILKPNGKFMTHVCIFVNINIESLSKTKIDPSISANFGR